MFKLILIATMWVYSISTAAEIVVKDNKVNSTLKEAEIIGEAAGAYLSGAHILNRIATSRCKDFLSENVKYTLLKREVLKSLPKQILPMLEDTFKTMEPKLTSLGNKLVTEGIDNLMREGLELDAACAKLVGIFEGKHHSDQLRWKKVMKEYLNQ